MTEEEWIDFSKNHIDKILKDEKIHPHIFSSVENSLPAIKLSCQYARIIKNVENIPEIMIKFYMPDNIPKFFFVNFPFVSLSIHKEIAYNYHKLYFLYELYEGSYKEHLFYLKLLQ